MKVAVTGAAGFTGSVLTEVLRNNDIEVFAFVRRGSAHNARLNYSDSGLHIIESELGNIEKRVTDIEDRCDYFFHIAWDGGRTIEVQKDNIDYTLDALKAAKSLGCKRFIATGSQAEYGIVAPNERQTEDRMPLPFTAYGAAKVASCYLSRQLAREVGIEWVWGRIFSLIGKNEPEGRMLPDLCRALREDRPFSLSSCRQNWDYLDVYDAADALISLAYKGRTGEIYNIASGQCRPLKDYVEEIKKLVNINGSITYGSDPDPFVSLQPSVEKILKDTGWKPKRSVAESIKAYGG